MELEGAIEEQFEQALYSPKMLYQPTLEGDGFGEGQRKQDPNNLSIFTLPCICLLIHPCRYYYLQYLKLVYNKYKAAYLR